MNPIHKAAWALAVVFPLSWGTLDASDGFRFFSRSWGDLFINTDTTVAGQQLPEVSPDQPVVYLGQSLGNRLGSIPGDRLPEDREMMEVLESILEEQGYIGSTWGQKDPEPSLFLIFQWGYLEPGSGDLKWFLGYNAEEDIAAPVFPGSLGPEVFRRNMRSPEIESILETAKRPIYGIIVTAFEFESASTSRPIVYWQTRIGLPARGKSMASALPSMLRAAGPMIGKPTDSPFIDDIEDLLEGEAEFGELEEIDEIPDQDTTEP